MPNYHVFFGVRTRNHRPDKLYSVELKNSRTILYVVFYLYGVRTSNHSQHFCGIIH
jgi:hypothetical protein